MLGEITKADLEMAVFLSKGEVDRYWIILNHDLRTFALLDEQLAAADTVVMPWAGLIGAEIVVNVCNESCDVITHVHGQQDDTGETGHVYRAPVM